MNVPCNMLTLCLLGSLAAAARTAELEGTSFWDQKESVSAVTFSPDGKLLITAGGNLKTGNVAFWSLAMMKRASVLTDTGMANHVAISPDGNTLVIHGTRHLGGRATQSGLGIWDVSTGKQRAAVMEAPENPGFTAAMDISPDGKLLAIGQVDGRVAIHDLATGKHIEALTGGKEAIWAVAFSPDGRLIAAGGRERGIVYLGNVTGRTPLSALAAGRGSVGALAFAPDGKTLVAGPGLEHDDPGELVLWDVAAGKEKARWQGHCGPVVGVRFSRDGKLMASGARSSDIRLWDALTGKVLLELEGPLNLSRLSFSPDGKVLAVAGGTGDFLVSSGGVRLWDMPSGRERLQPKAAAERDRREAAYRETAAEQAKAKAEHDKHAEAATRLHRAEYALKIHVARAHVERWEFTQARALLDELQPARNVADLRGLEWHLLKARLPSTLDLGPADQLHDAAIAPDGKIIAFALEDKLHVADAATGKVLFTGGGYQHRPARMAFSADGSSLAAADYTSGADPSDVKVYAVATGNEVASLTGHHDGVECLAFSRDAGLLASCGRSKRIIVWETKTWRVVRSIDDQKWIVGAVAFSPDTKALAFHTVFESLHVHDLDSGKPKFEPAPAHKNLGSCGLEFLDDGKQLLAGSDRGLFVVEAATGRVARRINGARTGWQTPLAVPPDGRQLIVGWSLVDLASGEELATFEQGARDGILPRKEHRLMALRLTPSGTVCMVVADRERVRFLSFPFREPGQTLSIGGDRLSGLAFSADGSSLLASTAREIVRKQGSTRIVEGYERFVERWDATTGAKLFRPHIFDTGKITLAFQPAQGAIVKAGRAKLSLADLAASQSHVTLESSKLAAHILGLSPDSGKVALQTDDDSVRLHDTITGTLLARVDKNRFVQFAPDSLGVYTQDGATRDRDLVLRDIRTGKERRRWQLPGYLYAMQLTPDGSGPAMMLLIDRNIRQPFLWDARLGEQVAMLPGHTHFVDAAAFSPDGNTLATRDDTGVIRLWDTVTGHGRGVLRGQPGTSGHVAFRPDGRALAVGEYGGTLDFWATPAK
jgi:WD40 repeat protein